jgi:uroporphyrinogen III methyltransferase / synthase
VAICAVGPATAAAVEREGGEVAVVPAEYIAEGVIEAMAAGTDLRGRRILLPRAEIAREILPARLAELGAEVHDVSAYRTLPDAGSADRLAEIVSAGAVDLVTFTSGSAARSFASLVGPAASAVAVASIGPVTSDVARELGMRVVVESPVHTTEGLLRAIEEHYGPAGAG